MRRQVFPTAPSPTTTLREEEVSKGGEGGGRRRAVPLDGLHCLGELFTSEEEKRMSEE